MFFAVCVVTGDKAADRKMEHIKIQLLSKSLAT